MQNPFQNPAFSMTSLTAAINILPNTYGRLEQLNLFHEGGTVGAGAPSRAVSPMLFATAPRYHSGGIAGLMPDEVPAILQRGEIVIPREQAGKMGGSSSPVINMTIVTRDAESFRQSRGQIMGDLAVSLARHKGRNT